MTPVSVYINEHVTNSPDYPDELVSHHYYSRKGLVARYIGEVDRK